MIKVTMKLSEFIKKLVDCLAKNGDLDAMAIMEGNLTGLIPDGFVMKIEKVHKNPYWTESLNPGMKWKISPEGFRVVKDIRDAETEASKFVEWVE